MEFNGVHVSQEYRDRKACLEFILLACQVVRQWGLAEMGEALAFAFMIDEGTDIGWEHVLIVYRKFLNKRAGKLTPMCVLN